MQAGMYEMSIPVFERMLTNLSTLLAKGAEHAAAHQMEPAAFLEARLYPDMFPLRRQVQIACDMAKGCAARLAGIDVPSWADEEKSFEDLDARVRRTIEFVRGVDRSAVAQSAERRITLSLRAGPREFSGLEYLNYFVMPNFYFHVTTTYALLRHNGVPLGKRDFIGG